MPKCQSSEKVRLLWPSRVREGYTAMWKNIPGIGEVIARRRGWGGKKG